MGQLEYSLSAERMRSLSSTSTVSKGTLSCLRICTTVFENPHCGKSLFPFMNSTTLLDATTLSRAAFSSGVSAARSTTRSIPSHSSSALFFCLGVLMVNKSYRRQRSTGWPRKIGVDGERWRRRRGAGGPRGR